MEALSRAAGRQRGETVNDELDRLGKALGADTPRPVHGDRERACGAAMTAFDSHRQGSRRGVRRKEYECFASWLRRLPMPLSRSCLAFVGVAAVLIVAGGIGYENFLVPEPDKVVTSTEPLARRADPEVLALLENPDKLAGLMRFNKKGAPGDTDPAGKSEREFAPPLLAHPVGKVPEFPGADAEGERMEQEPGKNPDNVEMSSDFRSLLMGLLLTTENRELASNYKKWKAQGIADYRFWLKAVCYCELVQGGPLVVDVRQGKVVKATYIESGRPVPPDDLRWIPTVEDLFVKIAGAVGHPKIEVEAIYHDRSGYPTFTATEHVIATDTFASYSIERLDILE